MMKVQVAVIHPSVTRPFPNPSEEEQHYFYELNIGCETWKRNTAMRAGFCELMFAGCGNHPGNELDQMHGFEFDAGDPGINNVHRQWAPHKTRSMSVGDLVCIDPNGLNEWWLCANTGFVILEGEQVRSWLEFKREYGCCMFEISKWLKENNLPV